MCAAPICSKITRGQGSCRCKQRLPMMPADYCTEIVIPTVLDLKSHRLSRRHAYLAAIVAFHIKDHLHTAGEKQIEKTMRADGLEFDLVRGICNGTKHVETDSKHV